MLHFQKGKRRGVILTLNSKGSIAILHFSQSSSFLTTKYYIRTFDTLSPLGCAISTREFALFFPFSNGNILVGIIL